MFARPINAFIMTFMTTRPTKETKLFVIIIWVRRLQFFAVFSVLANGCVGQLLQQAHEPQHLMVPSN